MASAKVGNSSSPSVAALSTRVTGAAPLELATTGEGGARIRIVASMRNTVVMSCDRRASALNGRPNNLSGRWDGEWTETHPEILTDFEGSGDGHVGPLDAASEGCLVGAFDLAVRVLDHDISLGIERARDFGIGGREAERAPSKVALDGKVGIVDDDGTSRAVRTRDGTVLARDLDPVRCGNGARDQVLEVFERALVRVEAVLVLELDRFRSQLLEKDRGVRGGDVEGRELDRR